MRSKVVIAVLCGVILWFSAVIVRIENERYALFTGMCRDKVGLSDVKCLSRTQTRTSLFWHLFYALTD